MIKTVLLLFTTLISIFSAAQSEMKFWVEMGVQPDFLSFRRSQLSVGAVTQLKQNAFRLHYHDYNNPDIDLAANTGKTKAVVAATNYALTYGYIFETKRIKAIPYAGPSMNNIYWLSSRVDPGKEVIHQYTELGVQIGGTIFYYYGVAGIGIDYRYNLSTHSYGNGCIKLCYGLF